MKLSNDLDSTLGGYRRLAEDLFGIGSLAVAFLDRKIAEQGKELEIILTEAQMTYLLGSIHRRKK